MIYMVIIIKTRDVLYISSLQENVLWEEYADGSLSIYQNVICEKDSQKVLHVTTSSMITSLSLSLLSLLIAHYYWEGR